MWSKKKKYLQLCCRSHFPLEQKAKRAFWAFTTSKITIRKSDSKSQSHTHTRGAWRASALTGFPVLLVFSVEAMHSFQQLPLFTAAGVVDEVPGEDLLQLAHREVLYGLLVVQVGQRGPDPPLRRRADLHAARGSTGGVTRRIDTPKDLGHWNSFSVGSTKACCGGIFFCTFISTITYSDFWTRV